MGLVQILDEAGLLDPAMLAGLTTVIDDMLWRMDTRNRVARVMYEYYDGTPPGPLLSRKATASYQELCAQSTTNFASLIIDSIVDRLDVRGFRVDGGDYDGDLWSLWLRNRLDVASNAIHREALITGTGYVSVGRRIRGESCFEVFHDPDPDDPARVARAVKVYPNRITNSASLTYMDGDIVATFAAPYDPNLGGFTPSAMAWVLVDVQRGNGVVPIVPFVNEPDLRGEGRSELRGVTAVLDRINTLTSQLLLAGELGAFKIRWATGLDVPEDEDGRPLEPFNIALDRLWVNESPDGKFGAFDATDLRPYAEAIDQAVQQVAAISRTPPYLLLGKITNLSADAIKATAGGLVQKVYSRMRPLEGSWVDVMRSALAESGDPRAEADITVDWVDPEETSEAARVDALTKLSVIGLPWRAVMERWGASASDIERWERQRADDAFHALLSQPAAPPQQQQPQQQQEQGEPA